MDYLRCESVDSFIDPTQPVALELSTIEEPLQPLTLPVHAELVPINGRPEDLHEMKEGCDEVVFGRDRKQCQVVVEDKRVSGRHLRLWRDSVRNEYFVEQLSSNGSFINNHRLEKGHTRSVQHGDEISLCLHAHEHREQPFAAYMFRVGSAHAARGGTQAGSKQPLMLPAAIFTRGRGQTLCPESDEVDVLRDPTEMNRLVSEEWVRRHWDMRKTLGNGFFSEVMLGIEVATGSRRAVKVVDKGKFSAYKSRHASSVTLNCEAELLTSLEDAGIVQVFEWFETDEKVYLIMELLEGGDLLDFILKHGCLSEPSARRMFKQLCRAVSYLHGRDIVHRDIKPENILLTSTDEGAEVKIADFGLARGNTARSDACNTFCGTPHYFAPEVITTFRDRVEGCTRGYGKTGYGKQVDMWSLGVVLYIMLSGKTPFSEEENSLEKQILEGMYDFDVPEWSAVSPEAKDLVRGLMTVDPSARLNVGQALAHPWFCQSEATDHERLGYELHAPKRRRTTPITPLICWKKGSADD